MCKTSPKYGIAHFYDRPFTSGKNSGGEGRGRKQQTYLGLSTGLKTHKNYTGYRQEISLNSRRTFSKESSCVDRTTPFQAGLISS